MSRALGDPLPLPSEVMSDDMLHDALAKDAVKPPPFDAAVFSSQGPRPEMEDTHVLYHDGGVTVGAIFDGHSGRAVADMCAAQFERKFRNAQGGTAQRLEVALREMSLLVTEKRLSGGACAVAFVATNEGARLGLPVGASASTLIAANLGDAELVWWSDAVQKAKRLTVAHRLDNAEELQRIAIQRGTTVQYPYYINGNSGLMPTRSVGDDLFVHVGLLHDPFVSEPVSFGPGWVVAACDGLWDVLEPEELPFFLNGMKTAQDAVAVLAEEALAVRKTTDNLTIIAVRVL